MNKFDRDIKRKASEEYTDIPVSVRNRIEQALAELPEGKPSVKRVRVFPCVAAAAVCFVFVTIFLLPNVSVAYAQTLNRIPVIGDIVRAITIRNYFYSDDKHEMKIDVPKITGAGDAAEQINQDISQLTETLVREFYREVELVGDEGHGSIYLDYETVTNTDTWFTLKIRVHRATGSSNTYYKFYHIDKRTNEIVKLGDLAQDDGFYDVLVQEIKRQMKLQMENDSKVVYWMDDSVFGKDIVSLTENHNFYWDDTNDLVITFDKYEVAPGSMGTPEFVISKEVIRDVLKTEYADLFSEY
ncbi:MAG: RsiV family protein [Lachnospiraceae bacterium]|nr:RsiV family protein [Lachnospiraceae bacterium]